MIGASLIFSFTAKEKKVAGFKEEGLEQLEQVGTGLEHPGVSVHQPLETQNFRKSGWVGHVEPGIHTHFQRQYTWLPYPAIIPQTI
jgi:hypothetical protein